MVYHSLKELGNNTLYPNDTVYFSTNGRYLKYCVYSNHLACSNYNVNAEIFSILGINKYDFCHSCYGYPVSIGDWPTCQTGDFEALTRVVKALYQEIEKRKEKVVYLENKSLLSELKVKLSDTLANPLLTAPLVEDKENTSSIISIKRKSRVKRIIGEEQIKLNNY